MWNTSKQYSMRGSVSGLAGHRVIEQTVCLIKSSDLMLDHGVQKAGLDGNVHRESILGSDFIMRHNEFGSRGRINRTGRAIEISPAWQFFGMIRASRRNQLPNVTMKTRPFLWIQTASSATASRLRSDVGMLRATLSRLWSPAEVWSSRGHE